MPLSQNNTIALQVHYLSGQTLRPELRVGPNYGVYLGYTAYPKRHTLVYEKAPLGTDKAAVLLSYVDLETGDFTAAGVAHAKRMEYYGVPLSDYFS